MSAKSKLVGNTAREIVQRTIQISKKLKETKDKNFFDIATMKPRDGVGMLFKQKQWRYNCYYTVTKVHVQPDGRHGQAWGILTWNGKPVSKETVIPAVSKRGLWKYISDEKLAHRMQVQQSYKLLDDHMNKVREQNEKYAQQQ